MYNFLLLQNYYRYKELIKNEILRRKSKILFPEQTEEQSQNFIWNRHEKIMR